MLRKNKYQDILELCGGTGGFSVAAFARGVFSAGNVDTATAFVDLGDPQVQRAIDHFFEVCYVLVLIVERNCRTTGPDSYFDKVADRSAWEARHKGDLPRNKFCGSIALKQNSLGRCWLREQRAGNFW